jgi:hypothetical protein
VRTLPAWLRRSYRVLVLNDNYFGRLATITLAG